MISTTGKKVYLICSDMSVFGKNTPTRAFNSYGDAKRYVKENLKERDGVRIISLSLEEYKHERPR